MDIEIVTTSSNEILPPNRTQILADAAAQIFGSPKGSLRDKLRNISNAR
ncbi:MAG: hypothetical protein QGD96_08645 [Anaerolineae bacterium]|nr:hypothetical protein [Anaerolineae bacterium]